MNWKNPEHPLRILEAKIYNRICDQRFADFWSNKIGEVGVDKSRKLIPDVLLAMKEVLDEVE
jgi:hypothetical protein